MNGLVTKTLARTLPKVMVEQYRTNNPFPDIITVFEDLLLRVGVEGSAILLITF